MTLNKEGISRELSIEEILIFMIENNAIGWENKDMHNLPKAYQEVLIEGVNKHKMEFINTLIPDIRWQDALCTACKLKNLDMISVCVNNAQNVYCDNVIITAIHSKDIDFFHSVLDQLKHKCTDSWNYCFHNDLGPREIFQCVFQSPLYLEMSQLLIQYGLKVNIGFYESAACDDPYLWQWMVNHGAALDEGLCGAYHYYNVQMAQWIFQKALLNRKAFQQTIKMFLMSRGNYCQDNSLLFLFKTLFLLDCGLLNSGIGVQYINTLPHVTAYISGRRQKQHVIRQCLTESMQICSDLSHLICTFIPYECS
jgi:hypothetical protein